MNRLGELLRWDVIAKKYGLGGVSGDD